MGEETDGVVTSVSKLQEKIKALSGVNILTESGDYKDTYTILKEIGSVWESMSDIDQSALLELMAGKNRANTLAAILGNMQDLEGAYNAALNSEGSALKENAAYLDSIQGKIDQFNNAVQTMWMNFLNDEVVKWIVQFGTGLVKLVDQFGLLNTAVGTFAAVKTIGFKGLKEELDAINKDSSKVLNIFGKKQDTQGLEDTVNAIKAVTTAKKAEAVATKENIIATEQETGATATGKVVKDADTGSTTANTAATWANVAATKALVIAKNLLKGLAFGIIAGIATNAITAGLAKLQDYFKSAEEKAKELKQQVDELTDSYKEAKKEFSGNLEILTKTDTEGYDDLLSEFEDLAKGVNNLGENVSLTTDEYSRYKEICEAIVGVNPSLAEGYDNATQAISANKGALAQLIELQKEEARLASAEYVSYGAYSKNGNFESMANSAIAEYKTAKDKVNDYADETGNNAITNLLRTAFDWDSFGERTYGDQTASTDDLAQKVMGIIGFEPDKIDEILQSYYNDLGEFDYGKWASDYADEIAKSKKEVVAELEAAKKSGIDLSEKTFKEKEDYAKKVLQNAGYDGWLWWDEKNPDNVIRQYTSPDADGIARFNYDAFKIDHADEIERYNRDFYTQSVNDFSEWSDAMMVSLKKEEVAANGMIDAYLQIPYALKEYDDLGLGTQSFITKWIQNSDMFKIDENTTQDSILAAKQTIIDTIQSIANGSYTTEVDGKTVSAQTIIDQMMSIDESKIDFGQYKESIRTLIERVWDSFDASAQEVFGDEANLAKMLGFDLVFEGDKEDAGLSNLKQDIERITGLTGEELQKAIDSLPMPTLRAMIQWDWDSTQANSMDFQGMIDTINPVIDKGYTNIIQTYSNLSEAIDKVNTALETSKEIFSVGAKVTEDYYDSLVELGISSDDLSECIDKESGYIVTNVDKLNELIKAQKDAVAWNIKLSKSQAELQYHNVINDLYEALNDFNNAGIETAESLLEQADALRATINQYQLLENSLLGATNAFTQFSKAQEIDSQNTYGSTLVEMAQTMYDAIYKTGEVGSEAFWAAVKATVPDDIYMGLAPGEQQIKAISRYLQDNLFSGLTFSGDSFSIDYNSIESFVKKAQSKGLFWGTDTKSFGLSSMFTGDLEDFADKMGVTKEYVYAMLSEIDKYNTNGMGLSMLLQLDDSTSSQLTIINTQLEQVLATRKQLIKQGKDLSDNDAQMNYLKSQQAGVKTKITADTSKYLTLTDILGKKGQEITDLLSSELIAEIGIEIPEDTVVNVEDVFQEISDYLLQLEEPTTLELEISKDNIQEDIDEIKREFGDEFETKLRIFNGEEQGELTAEEKNSLEEYSRLLNIDQLIGDAMSKNLTTTESLLTQIAKNTGIMAGTEEAPKKESETKTESTTTLDNNGVEPATENQQSEKPKINPEAVQYNMAVDRAIDDLMVALANKEAELLNSPDGFERQNDLDNIDKLQQQILEIRKEFDNPDSIIPTEDLMAQWSKVATEASKYGIEVPLTIKVNKDAISSDISDTAQEAKDAVSGVGDTAQETENELERLFTVSIPDSEAIKLLQDLTDEKLKQKVDSADAAMLGFNLDEEQITTYGDLLDRLIARSQTSTSGLYKLKQAGIETYSTLQEQVSSYNDLQTKTNEIMTNGTVVTQDYRDSIAALVEDQNMLNDCFEYTGDKIIVKNIDALEDLIKTAKKNTANNVKLAKSQAQLKYYKLVKELGQAAKGMDGLNDASGDTTKSIKDQIKEVKQAIYQYQLLEDNLLGTTNAFTNYKKAQDIDALNTYGDDYVSMVQTMYDALYKTGEVGTEQFWAAVDATVPTSKLEKAASDAERMKIIYDYLNKEILPSLTVKDGEISMNFKNIEKFVKQGIKAGVFTGNTKEFDLVEGLNLDEAAKKLGMTTTQAYTFFALLDKYNVARPEQSFLSRLDDSTSGTIMKLTTQMEELNDKKIALLRDGGYEKNKKQIDEINKQLAENDAKLKEIGKDAYDTWQAYTKTDAALAALKQIEDKTSALSAEDAIQLGIEWAEGMTVQDVINQLEEQLANLEATDALTAQLSIDYIDIQLSGLQTALDKVTNGGTLSDDEKVSLGLKIDVTQEELKAEIDAKIQALNEEKAGLAVTFGIELTEEEKATLQEELNAIEEFKINDKEFKVVANGTSTVMLQLRNVKQWLDGLKSKNINVTTTVTTVRQTTNSNPSGGGDVDAVSGAGVNGTAHVQGTARKSGSWGAPKTETSLVGELGPELLVRGNRWTTVGENGAEFTDVRKGDIIFNHKQTEDLLSKGYINGRGKAFAEGTAYAGLWTPTGSSSGSGSGKDDEDDFNEIFDWIAVRIEEITEVIELTSARLENAVGVKNKNSLIDEAIKANQKLYDNLTAGAATYYKYSEQLLAKIPAQYRAAAQNGSIAIEEFLGKVGEETYNAISDYREWVQKGADATRQAEEALTEISALAKQAIDNISAEFENRTSLGNNAISQLEAYNALIETTQGFEAAGIYQAMIKENNKNIQILRQQRNQMQAELNKRVEAGEIKKYSQDWYDAVNSIAEVDTEIINLTKDTNEYQDSVNELHWEQFDALIDRLDAISNESNNLIDILGNKDLVDEDTAEWTDEGITSLGLYAQQLEVAEMQAKKYRDEIAYLNKNWKALGYTEQEYAEKLEELKSGQYDAIKAYNDTKKSIVDLTSARVDAIKNGIEKEIESYRELIEAKKEELDSEKDLYDFQKSIRESEKDITEIQRKLAALSSDNSASARAQRAKLQAELAEAQANLEDKYYDRSVSDQQEALDKELEAFEKEKDAEIEKWEEYLEDTEQVVADALATIQSNTDVVYNTLSEMGKEYSLSIADSIVSPWQDGESAIQSYSEKFGLSMSSTVEQLKELEAAFKQTIAEIEKSSVEAVNTVQSNIASYQAAVNQTPARPSQPAGDVIVSGGGSSSSGSSYPYGRASDTSGNIKRGAKGDDVRAIQYALNQLGYGNSGTTSLDGNFGSGTESAVKSFQRAMGIKVDGIVGTNTRAKFRANGYASGTTGTKQNELAWIDEMGLEELVMHAGPNGRLQYLSKGTSVVPADLTSNLMEWGALDPQNMLDQNRPVISSPHITNNNIQLTLDVGEVVHIDTVTNDTIPDLTKTINKELDKYMKGLNSQIRKYVR